MKQEFLNFLDELMKNAPDVVERLMTETRVWKAKDVAVQLGISSRGASGTLRKLVNDGFCEKLGQDPVIYSLTEKGKNYVIIEGENE